MISSPEIITPTGRPEIGLRADVPSHALNLWIFIRRLLPSKPNYRTIEQ
jgi:hypothetical protein